LVSKTSSHLSHRSLYFRYSLIAIPLSFVGLPLYIHIPKFYYDYYQVDLKNLGIILLFLRLSDAFLDAVIGYVSDRNQANLKQIMILGGTLLIFGFNGLFWAPSTFGQQGFIIWFSLFTAISYLGYSLLAINFYGAGLNIDQTYEGRTTLSSWREGLGLGGVLLAAILPSFLEFFFAKQTAFQIYGGVLSVWIILALVVFPKLKGISNPIPIDIWSHFKKFLSQRRSSWWLFLLFFVNALPVGITSTLFLFFVDSALSANSFAGAFLAIYFSAAGVSTLFWNGVSKKWGKRKSLYSSMLLAIFSFMGSFYLTVESANWFTFICFLSGFALGGDLVLLPSLLADVVGAKTELRNMNFSLWQFINKMALGMTSGFLFLFLPQLAGNQTQAYSSAVLRWSYALIPCMIKMMAIIILYMSPIDLGREKK
jgi:GPH family glycoside/pentoside/hexuronide:cation symporter